MSAMTILVCDDEPHILHVVASKLKNAGFNVLTAEDGLEGFETARTHKPDLIVSDYQMPELSGLEMCARLRGEPGTAEIPVLMLTARGFAPELAAVEVSNIRAVLAKPFSPREVLAKVNELLGAGAANLG